MDSQSVYSIVNEKYSQYAQDTLNNQDHASKIAQAFGYDPEELQSLPSNANMGLSCGNPLATANLREGEVVIDLGSGGGIDVIFAAKKVGSHGRVYGIDRSKAMLDLASTNAQRAGVGDRTTFIDAPIHKIPLPDNSTDCIISNCVINLVPHQDKPSVFKEMSRLLKPGGRVAVSDILVKRDMPDKMRRDAALLVGCVAGASQVHEYRDWMADAGFREILVSDTGTDLNVYKDQSSGTGTGCCSKPKKDVRPNDWKPSSEESTDIDLNAWAASFQIYALKPQV